MPRPKPPEVLKPRSVRMSDTEFTVFNTLGGADWLRSRIQKMRLSGRTKAVRNRSMRLDHSKGASMEDLAKKYGVDRTTIWRIVT